MLDELPDIHRANTDRPEEMVHSYRRRGAPTSLSLDLGEEPEYLDKPTRKGFRYKSNLHIIAKENRILLIYIWICSGFLPSESQFLLLQSPQFFISGND